MGLGGLGNGLCLHLSAIGHQLTIQDDDTVELINCYPQQYKPSQIGISKVDAVKQLVKEMLDATIYRSIEQRFEEGTPVYHPIICVCVDNMATRKHVFDSWKAQEDRELLVDCRMSAEEFTLYAVTKDTEDAYEATLLSDSAIPDAPCTYKMTRFVAAIAQGIYTQTICTHVSGLPVNYKFHYQGVISNASWT